MKIQHNQELSRLVREYVIARDEAGIDVENEDTEDGLVDYPYIHAQSDCDGREDEAGIVVELLEMGVEIFEAAKGRPIYCTTDGVGIRIFFGRISDLLKRVRQRLKDLSVQVIMES